MLTKQQILKNRGTWTSRLLDKRARKLIGRLSNPYDLWESCCLGHGCLALNIEYDMLIMVCFGKSKATALAPAEFVELVGLNGSLGQFLNVEPHSSLSSLNDDTEMTPQEIGNLLNSIIKGGNGTPFRSLNDYPDN